MQRAAADQTQRPGRDVGSLTTRFLMAQDSDTFEALWRADPEEALQAIGELAEQAAKSGRMDLIEWLAQKAGGLDRLIQKAPQMLDALVADGSDEAVEGLVARAPFSWGRKRPTKGKPKRWEVDLVAAAIALNATRVLEDAIAQDLLNPDFFEMAELEFSRSLMFEARTASAVDFLASQGLFPSHRDENGLSALAYALSFEGGGPEEGRGLPAARRMAEIAEYDAALSADLVRGALDKPEVLEAGLRAGADPNARLSGERGALRAAIEAGHEQSAMHLARAGADPFAPDRDGVCAHEAASRSKKPDLAKAVSMHRTAQDALAAAVQAKTRAQSLPYKK
jgi:hypothetical protein